MVCLKVFERMPLCKCCRICVCVSFSICLIPINWHIYISIIAYIYLHLCYCSCLSASLPLLFYRSISTSGLSTSAYLSPSLPIYLSTSIYLNNHIPTYNLSCIEVDCSGFIIIWKPSGIYQRDYTNIKTKIPELFSALI